MKQTVAANEDKIAFRQSFEALNLGVVPSNPSQLIKLTIGGEEISKDIKLLLEQFPKNSVCRTFSGYYGSGKSHHLQLVRAIALEQGWVTAMVELDPKSADVAKPHSVYREIMSGLEFPIRPDSKKNEDFADLIKEMRENWEKIQPLYYFNASPWFKGALMALRQFSHRRDDQTYMSGVDWLAGQVFLKSAINNVAKYTWNRQLIPTMPTMKDSGVIYVYHLVVLNEILRALGYRGLAIIFDEAEHVRSYNRLRIKRAESFFDVLSRVAHQPRHNLDEPKCDFDISNFPRFWLEGPHIALFIGLTEGFSEYDINSKAKELKVLIPSESEIHHLSPPDVEAYRQWSKVFLLNAADHLGDSLNMLSNQSFVEQITNSLCIHYQKIPDSEKILRNWTKLVGLPIAILLSRQDSINPIDLISIIEDAAASIYSEAMPWE